MRLFSWKSFLLLGVIITGAVFLFASFSRDVDVLVKASFAASEGIVVDDTGRPVADATVTIQYECRQPNPVDSATVKRVHELSTTTNALGIFDVPAFDGGTSTVITVIPGSCRKYLHVYKKGYCGNNVEYCKTQLVNISHRVPEFIEKGLDDFDASTKIQAEDTARATLTLVELPEYRHAVEMMEHVRKNPTTGEESVVLSPPSGASWKKGEGAQVIIKRGFDVKGIVTIALVPDAETLQRGACRIEVQSGDYQDVGDIRVYNVKVLSREITSVVDNSRKPDADMERCFLPGRYTMNLYFLSMQGQGGTDVPLPIMVEIE